MEGSDLPVLVPPPGMALASTEKAARQAVRSATPSEAPQICRVSDPEP